MLLSHIDVPLSPCLKSANLSSGEDKKEMVLVRTYASAVYVFADLFKIFKCTIQGH